MISPPKEIKIFVSCPGDVTPEKEIIIESVKHINDLNDQSDSPVRYKVLDWRDLTESLDIRSQQKINDRFSQYSIYIGILWMRFGSRTGAINQKTGEEFDSGTYEEFCIAEEKCEAGEDLKMYLFFKKPIATHTISENAQYMKVLEFNQRIRKRKWVNSFPIDNESFFTNKIWQILGEYTHTFQKRLKLESKGMYIRTSEHQDQMLAVKVKSDFVNFLTPIPTLKHSISRTFTKNSSIKNPIDIYFDDHLRLKLKDFVEDDNRVVILGNPGSGKSTELICVANHFTNTETVFVPVYKRLNTFVDEKLEDLLPKGWNDIPPEICLILLDGLDEIQPSNFPTAIRRISSFSENNPTLRMVISCRTNFYDFTQESGTLPGFNVYHINNIRGNELGTYLENECQIEPIEFHRQAGLHGYQDLIWQPFFLNLIVEEYKAKTNLAGGKAILLNKFLEERIIFDQDHFKNTIDLSNIKEEVIQLLQRVALTMECLGRNEITNEELLRIVGSRENLNLLKHCTAFNLKEDSGTSWLFEHNNIQEYLAARSLTAFKTEQIKAILSFHNKRIKPTWVNTLFFLMSIIEEGKKLELIDWLVEIEPETLVRIEPDKISNEIRYKIFCDIFADYKQNQYWLRSNKFSNLELARFTPLPQGYDFLFNEFTNIQNTKIVRLNALHLIQVLSIPAANLNPLKCAIIQYIEDQPTDSHLFNSGISTLIALNLVDKELLAHFFDKFEGRTNQYIRAGLYSMINNLGLVDTYVDYYLEGIPYLETTIGDRENTSLFDESYSIKEGLEGIINIESIVKLFEFFSDPDDNNHINYFDRQDILKSTFEKAVALKNDPPELTETLIKMYVKYANHYEDDGIKMIANYFLTKGLQMEVFKNIFLDTSESAKENLNALAPIFDKVVLNYVINEYKERNLNNQQLTELYNALDWYSNSIQEPQVFVDFEDFLKKQTTILNGIVKQNMANVYEMQQLADFKMLFHRHEISELATSFFNKAGITDISRKDLANYRRHNLKPEARMPEPIQRMITHLLSEPEDKLKLIEILQFIENEGDYNDFAIKQIEQKISNKKPYELDQKQREFVELWILKTLKTVDIVNAVSSRIPGQSWSIDPKAQLIWKFVKQYKFKLTEDQLLDFSLFHEQSSSSAIGLDFNILEQLTSKKAVITRVTKNIKDGIKADYSWINNVLFAIQNNLTEVFPVILDELATSPHSYYFKRKVLEEYTKQVPSDYKLPELLTSLGTDGLRWDVINKLKQLPQHLDGVISYLRSVLKDDQANAEDQLTASRILTELNQEDGFNYFMGDLFARDLHNLDIEYGLTFLRSVTNAAFVDILIIMYKNGNGYNIKHQSEERLENLALEAIWSIGVYSEENLQKVKADLLALITTSQSDSEIRQITDYLERMEHSFYTSKSQNVNFEDALKEVDSFLLTV